MSIGVELKLATVATLILISAGGEAVAGWVGKAMNSQKAQPPAQQAPQGQGSNASDKAAPKKAANNGGGGLEVSSATGGGGLDTSPATRTGSLSIPPLAVAPPTARPAQ